jgi:hypothetical protein
MPPQNFSEQFADGDNLILFDQETGCILYGHEVLRQVIRHKRSLKALQIRVPAEAYLALLETCFTEVPEVRTYLAEVERTNTINPGNDGKLLEAASNAIWIEKRHLEVLLNVTDNEGDEWKGDAYD